MHFCSRPRIYRRIKVLGVPKLFANFLMNSHPSWVKKVHIYLVEVSFKAGAQKLKSVNHSSGASILISWKGGGAY